MTIQNEVLSAIAARRSCRAYLPEQIKPGELQAVLEAGTWAPTGMNRQSPLIVVVQDKETRDKLSAMNAAVMGNNGDPFYGAPTVLVVLADRNMSTHVEDGSLVLGNLLLAASSIGLGSCWINRAKEVFDTEEGKALLRKWGLDADRYRGIGNCILGYPAQGGIKPAAPRKPDYVVYV